MGQYFLIKEQKVNKGDIVNETKPSVISGVSFNTYDEAINVVKTIKCHPSEVIYVVEVVAKRYGDLKLATKENITTEHMSCSEFCPKTSPLPRSETTILSLFSPVQQNPT